MRVDADSLMYLTCNRGLVGDSAFRVLIMLACHMDRFGVVQTPKADLARLMGVTRVALACRLRELEEAGFLKRSGRSIQMGEHLFWKGKRTSTHRAAAEFVHRLTKRALRGGVSLSKVGTIG